MGSRQSTQRKASIAPKNQSTETKLSTHESGKRESTSNADTLKTKEKRYGETSNVDKPIVQNHALEFVVNVDGTNFELNWVRQNPNATESEQERCDANASSETSILRRRKKLQVDKAMIEVDELKLDWEKTRVILDQMRINPIQTEPETTTISCELNNVYHKISKAVVFLDKAYNFPMDQARYQVVKTKLKVEQLQIELRELKEKILELQRHPQTNSAKRNGSGNTILYQPSNQAPNNKTQDQEDDKDIAEWLYWAKLTEAEILSFIRGWLKLQPVSHKRSELQALVNGLNHPLQNSSLSEERFLHDRVKELQEQNDELAKTVDELQHENLSLLNRKLTGADSTLPPPYAASGES